MEDKMTKNKVEKEENLEHKLWCERPSKPWKKGNPMGHVIIVA